LALIPRCSSAFDSFRAVTELPTMHGITGVPSLSPVSRPASRASVRNSADISCSRFNDSGSLRIARIAASDAAAVGGGMPTL
jgi:hypothetical protein